MRRCLVGCDLAWKALGRLDFKSHPVSRSSSPLCIQTDRASSHLESRVAAFATVTHDKTGTKWVSSSNRDEGATEHETWKVSEDDTMEIEYLEDNGSQ